MEMDRERKNGLEWLAKNKNTKEGGEAVNFPLSLMLWSEVTYSKLAREVTPVAFAEQVFGALKAKKGIRKLTREFIGVAEGLNLRIKQRPRTLRKRAALYLAAFIDGADKRLAGRY